MSSVEPVRRLPNFVDVTAESLARRDYAITALSRLLDLRGYDRIETPILEQSELFVRKSGGELASRLYGFVEPGGYRVGLRPEFTAPVLRNALLSVADNQWPRRYQYAGPVFRYASPEDPDGAKTRQFTQVGAEAIGSGSPLLDGEIISTAIEGLRKLGIPEPIAVVGHVGILWDVLKPFGLSDRARLFLVNSVGQLRRDALAVEAVKADAERLGLTGSGSEEQAKLPPGASLDDVVAVIDATIGPTDRNAGVRTRSEIVERLARKRLATSAPASFDRAFDLVTQLARVRGRPETALKEGDSLVADHGGQQAAMDPLRRVVDAALACGVDEAEINVDLGLARGIAYYSGMLFDLHSRDVDGDSLGGGGRYDGLTRALGAESDLPALGFAYSLEAVLDAAGPVPVENAVKPRVVVAPVNGSAVAAALAEVAKLRAAGSPALLDAESRTAEARLAYARSVSASSLIVVDADGSISREDLQ